MRRLLFIVIALLLVAAAEITVLILVGQAIGPGLTILLVLATSALGGILLRRQGARAWRAFRSDVAEGRPPGNTATDGLLVFVGGVLMLVPGFITDAIGLLLLVPPVRRLGRAVVLRLFGRRFSAAAATSLFGPRRVKVRFGAPQHPESSGQSSAPPVGPGSPSVPPGEWKPAGPGSPSPGRRPRDDEPIEGEIIDPR
jgi:UPF0716 protein FxsA